MLQIFYFGVMNFVRSILMPQMSQCAEITLQYGNIGTPVWSPCYNYLPAVNFHHTQENHG